MPFCVSVALTDGNVVGVADVVDEDVVEEDFEGFVVAGALVDGADATVVSTADPEVELAAEAVT